MKLSSILFKLFTEVQDFTDSDAFEACSKSEIKFRLPKNVKAPNSVMVEVFCLQKDIDSERRNGRQGMLI